MKKFSDLKISNIKNKKKFVQSDIYRSDDYLWLYGKHPVLMSIFYRKRKLYQLFLTKNSYQELQKFLAENNLQLDKNLIEIVDDKKIESLFQSLSFKQVIHQGFALRASHLPMIYEDNFLANLSKLDKDQLPKILILDGLTDPHNVGAIIRSAVAFGVKNILISQRNSPKDTAVMAKSSSGMIEAVNLILAKNLNNLLLDLKKIGYWCIGLDAKTKTNISQVKDYQNIALVVGSEGLGIRHLVKQNCDLLVKIPMSSEVESLNVSNAVAISLYELYQEISS